jgi:hypothetical protein
MLNQHSAVVLPFRASAQRAPEGPARDGSLPGEPGPAPDNVVPLHGNVIVLAELAHRVRQAGRVVLFPPPGGDAA